MSINNNIVTSSSNSPVVQIVQDALVGAYLMTSPSAFIDKPTFFDLVFTIGESHRVPPPAFTKPSQLWTGSQLLSLLLPSDFDLTIGDLEIQGGIIIKGRLSKKSLGPTAGGLIHRLFLHYSPAVCAEFIGKIQLAVNLWMTSKSLSVGIQDCCLPEAVAKSIRQDLEEGVEELTDPYETEDNSRRTANALRDEVAVQAIESFRAEGDSHGFTVMAASGSKGGAINIAQITTCVGQQSVQGQRITGPNGRGSSHFFIGDPTPKAHGFVSSSYIKGLDPIEFFKHAQGGREGLIDTAPVSGDVSSRTLCSIPHGRRCCCRRPQAP